MDEKKIENEIRLIIDKYYGRGYFDSNLDFMNGVNGWDFDSLEFVQLIVYVEERFNIIIDFDEEFHTMNELVEIVAKKMKKEEE